MARSPSESWNERSLAELGEELDQLALGGRGWAAVLRRLSGVLAVPTRFIGVHGEIMAASDAGDGGLSPTEVSAVFAAGTALRVRCSDGWDALAVPVSAGARRVGVLLAGSPLSPDRAQLLRAARTAIAVEAVRRDTMAEARAERASLLIDELRFGPLRHPDEVSRAAERFGLPLDLPHAAAVFAYDGPNRRTWRTALSWIEMPVHVDGERGWTLLTGDVPAELARIRIRLEGMVGDSPVYGATGPVVAGVLDTARSFREAEIVLALCRSEPGRVEMDHASLGLAGLLIGLAPERLDGYVTAHLGPILGRTELVETLEVWLRCKGSRSAVAAELNLHRNSVGYRIGRVRDLLGADPLDAPTALQLESALVARRILLAHRTVAERREAGPHPVGTPPATGESGR